MIAGGGPEKVRHIRWQRLVDATGRTCERCASTGAAVERAVDLPGRSLRELGIVVALKTEALRKPGSRRRNLPRVRDVRLRRKRR